MGKTRIGALFFLLSIALLICGFTAKTSQSNSKVLKVGTNAEFAPFSYIEGKEIKGFEIDLAKEICKRLGYQMKIVDLPFEALVTELKKHTVNFVAAGMSITEERAEAVNFTNPYLEDNPLVAVYLKNHGLLEDLKELKENQIVVNEGYTADHFVTNQYKIQPLRLQNPIEGIMALKSKRAQVYITAKNTLSPFLKDQKNAELTYFEIKNTSDNCAIMLPKDSIQLLESINQILEDLKKEGFIEDLKNKWGI